MTDPKTPPRKITIENVVGTETVRHPDYFDPLLKIGYTVGTKEDIHLLLIQLGDDTLRQLVQALQGEPGKELAPRPVPKPKDPEQPATLFHQLVEEYHEYCESRHVEHTASSFHMGLDIYVKCRLAELGYGS